MLPTDIRAWVSSTASYAVTEPTTCTYYIYDWFAENKPECLQLFQSLILDARESGCKSLMAYANSSAEVDYLKSIGFVSMRTPVKVIYFPKGAFAPNTKHFHYCIYDSDGNL